MEGRFAFATDDSTQNPTDPRLRFCGVGIAGSPGSSWASSSAGGGVIQQNDKAEVVALVPLVQAAVANAPRFPCGMLVRIDNKPTLIFQGTRPKTSITQ